ncbi:CYTH-like domain-containing protein [Polychytrium aggregatum]|uniref:CYTH-like domain-containing protein n=1 Tax=Polychytrium aggregatum TaxID=110093 RepID=UPI0022FF0549|nr:CYTH-like domain-containing protein [Polychytrium aggregatum]KAI9207147.1 CYTH-like domain-containing protein [Polychytrium aggregatum]
MSNADVPGQKRRRVDQDQPTEADPQPAVGAIDPNAAADPEPQAPTNAQLSSSAAGAARNHAPLSRLEPSIFNSKPSDDILKYVSEFLAKYIKRPHVEIEAKIGLMIDNRTNQRIYLPVRTETVLADDRNIRFASDMTMDQHAHYNRLLNNLTLERGSIIRYTHLREVDSFYYAPSKNVRVTTNEGSSEIKAIVIKKKVATIDVYCPAYPLDYRISVSEELPAPKPQPNQELVFRRKKDRLSYAHQIVQVDLTQVRKLSSNGNETDLTHELELEIRKPQDLQKELHKHETQQPNLYRDHIDILLNSVRILARRGIGAR